MDNAVVTQTVRSYFSDLCAKDAEKWIQLFTQDALTYDPVGNPPNKVHETYQKFFQLLDFYSEMKITPGELFMAGDEAAVQWQMSVIAKNGREGEAAGITVFTFDESGKISQLRAYWDDQKLMAQLR